MRVSEIRTNLVNVDLKDCSIYISYSTVIAFHHKGKLYISENNWSNTTGKHLNEINTDKKIRMPYSEFKEKFNELCGDVCGTI